MMEQPKQAEFTADEFIAWALEQPTGRFELDNGTVVAMAPERRGEQTERGNLWRAVVARNLNRFGAWIAMQGRDPMRYGNGSNELRQHGRKSGRPRAVGSGKNRKCRIKPIRHGSPPSSAAGYSVEGRNRKGGKDR